DTSGNLLSKEARAGTTTIAIGKAVKQTVDTRFYQAIDICVDGLATGNVIVPGTEAHLCTAFTRISIPAGSGYTVTAPGFSAAACPASGGGLCPSDKTGVAADFRHLTGDDVRKLIGASTPFHIHDDVAGQVSVAGLKGLGLLVYGELKAHHNSADLQHSVDLFHTVEAHEYCKSLGTGTHDAYDIAHMSKQTITETLLSGDASGGTTTSDSTMRSLYIGNMGKAISTGGDTNPEAFVAGSGEVEDPLWPSHNREYYREEFKPDEILGTRFPSVVAFVNGKRAAATTWSMWVDGAEIISEAGFGFFEDSVGWTIANKTGWNLSDFYYVNNYPGPPYTNHKGNGDSRYHYVTQVNYVTGYICKATLP
ncbi:hypothetical protein QFB55_004849, partial [Salmonella enterica]|nr:hypothetical protein [Salmonella enterica]